MTYDVTWRPEANDDFDNAYAWYENEKPGLGDEFAEEVGGALKLLKQNPKVHAKVYHDVRRAVLRKFPYTLYYYIEGKTVVVLSVFHGKRNPDIWKSRI